MKQPVWLLHNLWTGFVENIAEGVDIIWEMELMEKAAKNYAKIFEGNRQIL